MKRKVSFEKQLSKHANCADCGLHKRCLSRSLNCVELKLFEEIVSTNLRFQSGKQLYYQGDPFRGLYIIKSGSAKSYVDCGNGELQIVNFQFPSDILGLDAFEFRTFSSSVQLLENSIVCHVPCEIFNQLCDKLPRLCRLLRWQASSEIIHDHEILIATNQKTAEARVAFFLVEIFHRLDLASRSTIDFNLSMSRQDIASYLGLNQNTVSRIFAKFQRNGLIAISGKHAQINDRNRLEQLVGCCIRCGAPLIY